jgi:hypothetical protein
MTAVSTLSRIYNIGVKGPDYSLSDGLLRIPR